MDYRMLYEQCLQAEQKGEKTLLIHMKFPRVPRSERNISVFLDGPDSPTGKIIRQPLFGYKIVEFYVSVLLTYLKPIVEWKIAHGAG